MDKIIELLERKKGKINTDLDLEKYNHIKEIIKHEDIFFYLDMSTVLGILEFLDVEPDERLKLYYSLTSMENYEKNIPNVRIINGKK